ncbi:MULTISPECIES: DUF2891 domain-containing protein [Sorangium]|uniref:DUF2891 domain-containing protein n=1 Tax=Sorangium cellulosum TaxID=56 RepID=A0A4P2R188_SORCE|nr:MULTISPECIES: DUF2891 domain-containing protein [Sorangium]AUX35683.1 hypothetical protein SOCE836_078810 [Sorangium cellulosum]WCQ94984.1 hypothetical protein NQZ70_07759 [Sorangium sp. Soce836]
MAHVLTPDIASRLASIALGHVTREYPNKLDHVMSGPEDVKGPRDLHPIFYGSFDWHSCVHGHWLLARVYRLFPGAPGAAAIRALLDAQLTADKVAAELDYLRRPARRGFERPYGWAWLLLLAAELARYGTGEGQRWSAALAPLGDAFAERFLEYLPRATYPVRAGAHTNSAFALALALEYAAVKGDERLARRCAESARAWYGRDADCQAWEPSQDDFLSPALMEAECMRRVLSGPEFRGWFARFLPRAADGEPATLFAPATVSDRSDGKIAHLDGLNLSRAFCWRSLAAALPEGDPVRARAFDAAERHLDTSLPHVAGDYMGEHWLASFALLALGAGAE